MVKTVAIFGDYVATGSSDHTARIWSLASGRCVHILHHRSTVQYVAFSEDGRLVHTISEDGIDSWSLATGDRMLWRSDFPIYYGSHSCSRSFKLIVRTVARRDVVVNATMTEWCKQYSVESGDVCSCAITNDDNFLLISTYNGKLHVYYLFHEEKEVVKEVMMGSRDKTSSIGRVLLARDGDNAIMRRVWGLLQA